MAKNNHEKFKETLEVKNITIERDESYNTSFKKATNIKFYPYVGSAYSKSEHKILVFGHNYPVPPKDVESVAKKLIDPMSLVYEINNYTYLRKKWTMAFRQFVRGSLGIKNVYSEKSNVEILIPVKSFVESISFVNFISDLVSSDKKINVNLKTEEISESIKINKEIINILAPTHIICWGQTFEYIKNNDSFQLKNYTHKLTEDLVEKKGFAYAILEHNGLKIHILKIFHPSMPGFGHRKEITHQIMDWFYKLKPLKN